MVTRLAKILERVSGLAVIDILDTLVFIGKQNSPYIAAHNLSKGGAAVDPFLKACFVAPKEKAFNDYSTGMLKIAKESTDPDKETYKIVPQARALTREILSRYGNNDAERLYNDIIRIHKNAEALETLC